MIVIISIVVLINVCFYAFIYFNWKKDCKEIGKNNLAVSLGERMIAGFWCVTFPCLFGLIVGFIKWGWIK